MVFPMRIIINDKVIEGNHIIGKKYYKIICEKDNSILIKQDGEKDDNKKYYMYFKYNEEKNNLFLLKSKIYEEINRSKYDSTLKKRVQLPPIKNLLRENKYSKLINFNEAIFYEIFK
jgi:hypothetical protein